MIDSLPGLSQTHRLASFFAEFGIIAPGRDASFVVSRYLPLVKVCCF